MLFDFILKQSKPDVVDDTMVVRGRQIPLAVVRNHRARRYLLRLRPDGSVRLPGLRNCGAVVEATFIPAQIICTFGVSRRKIAAQLFFCARSISSFNARSLESREKISVSASENLSVAIPI